MKKTSNAKMVAAYTDEDVDRIAKDLKKRGMKYIGSVTVYAHLQACGIINDHVKECFRYQELVDSADTERVEDTMESVEVALESFSIKSL